MSSTNDLIIAATRHALGKAPPWLYLPPGDSRVPRNLPKTGRAWALIDQRLAFLADQKEEK